MRKYIGWDAPVRVEHNELEMERFLKQLPTGTPIALESSGNWHWLVRAMEEAVWSRRLAHALEVKQPDAWAEQDGSSGCQRTGDDAAQRLAARGLDSAGKLLDLRDLMRTRLATRQQGSELKCRILAALRRYVRRYEEEGDLFTACRRAKLPVAIGRLPQECRMATTEEWALLDQLEAHIEAMEERIRQRIASLGWVRLLKTLPGVGTILGSTIYLEIGEAARFASPEHLASYAGLVPTVHRDQRCF
jgi:transposase